MYKDRNTSQCSTSNFITEETISCSSWKFNDDLMRSTAVEDFEMVCDNKGRKSLTQTIYMLGMLIGNILAWKLTFLSLFLGSFMFGWLSDFFGRKPTLMLSLTLLSIAGSLPFFITPKVSNYYTLVIFR